VFASSWTGLTQADKLKGRQCISLKKMNARNAPLSLVADMEFRFVSIKQSLRFCEIMFICMTSSLSLATNVIIPNWIEFFLFPAENEMESVGDVIS